MATSHIKPDHPRKRELGKGTLRESFSEKPGVTRVGRAAKPKHLDARNKKREAQDR